MMQLRLRRGVSGHYYLGHWRLFTDAQPHLLQVLQELVDDARVSLVVTTNVDHVVTLSTNVAMREAYSFAEVRTIDGSPIQALARALGLRRAHRNSGADLLPAVCSSARFDGRVIAVTGGTREACERAARRLDELNPSNRVHAVPFPEPGHESLPTDDVVSALRELRPDITFVCLGAPKQELWVYDNRHELPHGVYVCAGAAVDFASGLVRRAPLLMRTLGIEWAFRLAQEPRRLWRRYLLRAPRFIPVAFRSLATHLMLLVGI